MLYTHICTKVQAIYEKKKKQKKNKQDRKKVKVKKGEADKILITLQ